MKRAEKRIKDFQKANDTFNMDVDLETAAARAHLAYFTRPRTVDIFAEFKGTDLGKIMSGMTAGATGVRGVQNEWQFQSTLSMRRATVQLDIFVRFLRRKPAA